MKLIGRVNLHHIDERKEDLLNFVKKETSRKIQQLMMSNTRC